jgi:DNA-binding MarR family transcriptional regulator
MTTAAQYQAALDRVFELVVLMAEDMAHSLGRQGLTTSRAHLLWELQRSGPTTQQSLATAMNVSARNITGLVDGLVAAGFVSRQPHPTDRRATLVTFTELGASTTQAMRRDQKHLAQQLFSDLPADRFNCLFDGLGEVLTRLHRAIAEQDQASGPASARL